MDNLCPIDGRYRQHTAEIRDNGFTERELILTKARIELEWLLHLIPIFRRETNLINSNQDQSAATRCLREILRHLDSDTEFRDKFAKRVTELERSTLHDTKAVELTVREYLLVAECPEILTEMTHVGLTSEDVSGSAYAIMFHRVQTNAITPLQKSITGKLRDFAKKTKGCPILSMTHGQPASPTTFGKELCVFLYRLKMSGFEKPFFSSPDEHGFAFPEPRIKFGGAVGSHGALCAAFPNVDWLTETEKFVRSLIPRGSANSTSSQDAQSFRLDLCTTQIPNREWMLMRLRAMELQNNVLTDLARDMWLYISRGLLELQKGSSTEVGSSTMPHKINPIDFENAEGNFALANAVIDVVCTKLSQSRMQRDLSDSTVIRNLGLCFSYTIIAYKSLLRGLSKVSLNTSGAAEELASHPEIVAEPIQTILRKYPADIKDPYEQLKAITRGAAQGSTRTEILQDIRLFVETLANTISKEDHDYIQTRVLSAQESYIGLSEEIADRVLAMWN